MNLDFLSFTFACTANRNSAFGHMRIATASAQTDQSVCCPLTESLLKYAYSNILKILQPKKVKFSDRKVLIFFSFFFSKHRLWVLVRTASLRRF